MAADLPKSNQLLHKIFAVGATFNFVGVAISMFYLIPLCRFTPDQGKLIVVIVLGLFAPLGVVSHFRHKRRTRWIVQYLEEREKGQVSDETRELAFHQTIDLPRWIFGFMVAFFLVGGTVAIPLLVSQLDEFPIFAGITIYVAMVTMSSLAQIPSFICTKRILSPIRDALGSEIRDPGRRQELARTLPLTTQIVIVVVGFAFGIAISTMSFSEGLSQRRVENFAMLNQRNILQQVESRLGTEDDLQAAIDSVSNFSESIGVQLVVLSPDASEVIEGNTKLLSKWQLSNINPLETESGDSSNFESLNTFTWRTLSDSSEILVAVTPDSYLGNDLVASTWMILAVSLVTLLVSSLVAALASKSLRRTTDRLREKVLFLTAGDMRHNIVCESENELGELSRTMDSLGKSLRDTVRWIRDAAGGIETSSVEVEEATRHIVKGAESQLDDLTEARSSMTTLRSQVREIAAASDYLHTSVEQSSSSISELRMVSTELSGNASTLVDHSNETSSSVSEILASVRQVSENTSALSEMTSSADDHLRQMAEISRGMENTAQESSELSSHVVLESERGHEKVAETIRGMEEIRVATETVNEVIQDLAKRSEEIGSTLNVIGGVADETNLLALNAAIIAAQAGEHGRAFSVVADEIKDLADRVITHTKEIETVIHGVQEQSQRATVTIAGGVEKVNSGVDLAAEAGVALDAITTAVRESGAQMKSISEAVQRQVASSEEVGQLMSQVRHGMEQIEHAGREQVTGSETVLESAERTKEIAQHVHATTEQQMKSAEIIDESVLSVENSVSEIQKALMEQAAACDQLADLLERTGDRANTNSTAARQMDATIMGLREEAEQLRDNVNRFKLSGSNGG